MFNDRSSSNTCSILPICAGIAIKHGMKEEKALESITINPAKSIRNR